MFLLRIIIGQAGGGHQHYIPTKKGVFQHVQIVETRWSGMQVLALSEVLTRQLLFFRCDFGADDDQNKQTWALSRA